MSRKAVYTNEPLGRMEVVPDFLPPPDLVIGVLQSTNNKYIRVVPAFAQGRVRKQKPNRLFE